MRHFLQAHTLNHRENHRERSPLRRSFSIMLLLMLSGVASWMVGWGTAEAIAPPQTSPNPANGAIIFEANCIGCHANGGNIIRRGKNLKQRALERYHMDSLEAIATITAQGKRPMSAYGDRLTQTEIYDVAAYVLQQAEAGWPR
jgi:cytochrome c6